MLSTLLLLLQLFCTQPSPAATPSHAAPHAAQEPTHAIKITRGIKYIDRPGSFDHFTSLDIYQPAIADDNVTTPMPILIYVHGGGWAIGDKSRVHEKPEWAMRNGWILISVNYRLTPQVMHPEHARDVAAAVAYVHKHANDFGGDPDQIIIMGHSAGAHLAAIVASEESLLAEHNLTPGIFAAVVLLDGAGYDLPTTMNSWLSKKYRDMYEQAFGLDPKLWIQASPTLQATPNDSLAPLLGIHAGKRIKSQIATTDLIAAWAESGAQATAHHAPDKDHAGINHDMGKKNDPDTRAVEEFIHASLSGD